MLKPPIQAISKLCLALFLACMVLPLATTLVYADDPLVVNNTGDDGDFDAGDGTCETGSGNGICTLRAAIEESNADIAITHTIQFSITGAGPHTFTPATALPDITHPVTIDGLTQPGASCDSWPPTLLIEIDGTSVPAQVPPIPTSPSDLTPPIGLNLLADNSTIRGLVINNFDKLANTGAPFNVDIDMVGVGVVIDTSQNNTISCNFLGTEPNGTSAAPNQMGVSIGNGSSNIITGNLISGNGNGGSQTAGVVIGVEPVNGGEAAGNQLIGNFIGTDKNGTADLGNEQDGILLVNARNTIISGNLISGNNDDGVDVTDVATLTITFPVVGDLDFSLACDTPPCATGNVIQYNTIGLDINGSALGNGNSGIEIKNGEQNQIYANDIAYNVYQGVEINERTAAEDACTKGTTPCTISNTVSANRIYMNTGLGIDLTANSSGGVTPNGSGPDGANRLQNYPVLSSALTNTTSVHVSGLLTGSANSNFTVELFASDSCDASGYGEGQTFIISDTVTTNSGGEANFTIIGPLPSGTQVSATATDSGGNTSEFSACQQVAPLPDLAITKTVELSGSLAIPGEPITYTVIVENSGGSNAEAVVITDTLPAAVAGMDLIETVTVTAGASLTFIIPATITDAAGYNTTINNTAYYGHISGNGNDSASFTTIADMVPPAFVTVPVLITPTGGLTLSSQQPLFDWEDAVDNETGVVSYTLVISISNDTILVPSTYTTVVTMQSLYTPAVALDDGVYTWTVQAYDAAGNGSGYVSPETFNIEAEDSSMLYLPVVVKDN